MCKLWMLIDCCAMDFEMLFWMDRELVCDLYEKTKEHLFACHHSISRTFPKLSRLSNCAKRHKETSRGYFDTLVESNIHNHTLTNHANAAMPRYWPRASYFFFFIISIQRFSFHLSFTFLAFFRSALQSPLVYKTTHKARNIFKKASSL